MKVNFSNIILTLDYEIFFGSKSGSVEKCILEPTDYFKNKILKVYPVKTIIFVDFLFLWKLKENGFVFHYEKIKKQINELVEKYNCIMGLHIHSHWLDSIYDSKNNNWIFKNYKRYIFPLLSNNEIKFIINKCKKVLSDMLPGYNVEWFRAGGWCIEPFYKIAPYLKEFGIRKDSSVVHNFYLKTIAHSVDFRKVPLKPFWKFDNSVLEDNENGYFEEYPITSAKIYPVFSKLLNILTGNNISKQKWGDGVPIGINHNVPLRKKLFLLLKKLVKKHVYMLNFENMSAKVMKIVINNYIKMVKFDENNPTHKIVFIAHPKGISPWSIEELNKFLKQINER